MKAGVSLDGRITYERGKSGHITGPESLAMTHKLRDLLDAIMVGVDTILIDDPSLTTRLSRRKGKDPIRVIIDTNLRIPLTARILHMESKAKTWIFCHEDADIGKQRDLTATGAVVVPVAKKAVKGLDLTSVLQVLGQEGITSVLVEGGARLHGSMLEDRLVDHVRLFLAPIFAGDGGISVVDGVRAANRDEAICLNKVRYKRLGDDLMIKGDIYYPASHMNMILDR
jgi:diaminohydroxyphosphoribosylaminopyrimidine deaminase/5-amino-6-(5-phosphoribosylamino)uracil reductase